MHKSFHSARYVVDYSFNKLGEQEFCRKLDFEKDSKFSRACEHLKKCPGFLVRPSSALWVTALLAAGQQRHIPAVKSKMSTDSKRYFD